MARRRAVPWQRIGITRAVDAPWTHHGRTMDAPWTRHPGSYTDRHAGERNRLDMAVVGAAAAAEHAEVAELPAQRAIALPEIGRIAGVEIRCRIKFGVAARRCICPQAAQTRDPIFVFRLPLAQDIGEMRGMR